MTATRATHALVEVLAQKASNFLDSLTEAQRRAIIGPFDDPLERCDWNFVPFWRGKFTGIVLSDLDEHQHQLVFRLLAPALSRHAFVAALTSTGALEKIIDDIEQGDSPIPRSSFNFRLAFFGAPSATGSWAWRFQGHHVSINYTIVDGKVISTTPTFLGANPARVAYHGYEILRPLSYLEDFAKELLFSLRPDQRARAIVAEQPPYDNTLWNNPLPSLPGGATVPALGPLGPANEAEARRWADVLQKLRYDENRPLGITGRDLSDGQRDLLARLVGAYVDWFPDGVVPREMRRIDNVHFAWAGAREPRMPHYFRLQGDDILVEYDNARDELARVGELGEAGGESNHIHTVVRHPRNDFGAEMLGRHYLDAHLAQATRI